jgi:hypothetical protein
MHIIEQQASSDAPRSSDRVLALRAGERGESVGILFHLSSHRRAPHPRIVLYVFMLMLMLILTTDKLRRAPYPFSLLFMLLLTKELCERRGARLGFPVDLDGSTSFMVISILLSRSKRGSLTYLAFSAIAVKQPCNAAL